MTVTKNYSSLTEIYKEIFSGYIPEKAFRDFYWWTKDRREMPRDDWLGLTKEELLALFGEYALQQKLARRTYDVKGL